MKPSTIISTYRESIADALRTAHRNALDDDGAMQYSVYVWSDGTIQTLEDLAGGHTYLRARDEDPRTLVYVATVGGNECRYSYGLNGDETDEDISNWLDELADEWEECTLDAIIDDRIEELDNGYSATR